MPSNLSAGAGEQHGITAGRSNANEELRKSFLHKFWNSVEHILRGKNKEREMGGAEFLKICNFHI